MELHIKEIAEKILNWLYVARLRVLWIIIVAAVLAVLSMLPYFNLFLSLHAILFILISVGLFILKISSGRIVLIAIGFLLASLIMYLAYQFDQGELIGNYVYGLFFLASLKAIFEK